MKILKEVLSMGTREPILGTNKIVSNAKMNLCGIVNAKSGICDQDCRFYVQSSLYDTSVIG